MPFIDSKITARVTPDKRENIKSELGKAIRLLNKTESYLMVGIEDGYDLYLGGKKLDEGAYVSVQLYGNATADAYDRMTGEICRIYEQELGIPGQNVYVTYQGISDWGWNGRNF